MAKILKKREVPGKDVVEYLVQWVGDWADTWESEKMLRGCRDMLSKFDAPRKPARKVKN